MLKLLKRFLLGLVFRLKKSLPDPPPKQFQTTDQPGLLGLADKREFEDRTVQEQSQWLHKANDLRDAIFDLHPVWKNNVGPTTVQTTNAVWEGQGKSGRDVYADIVPNSFNTWLEKNNPKKNYTVNNEEAKKLQKPLQTGTDFEIIRDPHYQNNFDDTPFHLLGSDREPVTPKQREHDSFEDSRSHSQHRDTDSHSHHDNVSHNNHDTDHSHSHSDSTDSSSNDD